MKNTKLKMFKRIVLLPIACLIVLACRKTQDNSNTQDSNKKIIVEFLSSRKVARVIAENPVLDRQDISIESSRVSFYKDEKDKPWISLVFKRKNQVYAVLKGIRVSDSKIALVKEQYLTSLFLYPEFSFESLSGKISVIDTDEGSRVLGVYSLENGKLGKSPVAEAGTHFCDTNHNGNVTWTECFTCMVKSCMSHGECAVQCALYDVYNGSCTRAIDIACGVIAIIY